MTTEETFSPRGDLGPVRLRALCPVTGAELASGILEAAGSTRLGRGASVGLSLPHGSVSEVHADLHHRGSALRVVDLCSRNGTFLGGYRVVEGELQPGARLQLGEVSIEVAPAGAPLAATAPPLPLLIGRSTPMLRLSARVRRLAALEVPVLVRGESGTGKELVARALHDLSRRSAGPFVAINAATLSRELGESELFGHRRGSFTGAVTDRAGAFREAAGGTLFIDELGSLAVEVQAKLLRAVEDGLVRPLGQDTPVPVDVRLLAATCQDVEDEVAQGSFRRDLYERIAVSVVRVPPLRDRTEDIPLLAKHLLVQTGFTDLQLTGAALGVLARDKLHGNVRELRALVVLSAVTATEEGAASIDARHVVAAVAERRGHRAAVTPADAHRALSLTDGNRSAAARMLGLPRTTLRDLLSRRPGAP